MTSLTNVVLIGPMAAGKTSIGSALAARLEWPYRDSDAEIEALCGRPGLAIAQLEGVERLHSIELEVFLSMMSVEEKCVVSAAESVIDSPMGREVLARHHAIWLDAASAVLLSRRSEGDHRRLMSPRELSRLRAQRSVHLGVCTGLKIDTSTSSVVECVNAAVAWLSAFDNAP